MIDKRLKKIAPDQLDMRLAFLRPLSPGSVDRMRTSLIKRGQLTPITVVTDEDRFILVDGFKRLQAAVSNGLDGLMATIAPAGNVEAKAMVYLLNRPDTFSVISEAILIRDLVDVEGLTQTETASLLDRHKSWVSRRLMMLRSLSPEIIDEIKLKLLPAGVGSSLARLPQDNQADFAVAIQTHGLRSQEVNKLVDLWCKTIDPAVRQCLLNSPRQALGIVKEGRDAGQGKWLALIQSILANIAALGKKLQGGKVSVQIAIALRPLLDQAALQIEQTRKYIRKRANEQTQQKTRR